MVKGELKEINNDVTEFQRHIGFVRVDKIVAVNPTLEERAKLFGSVPKEDAEEIVYASNDDEGNQKIRIDIFFSTTPDVGIKRHSITMVNKERTNKEGTKNQYINQVGVCTWPDAEGNLQKWFKNFTNKQNEILASKTYRKALKGEELLFTFIRALFRQRDSDVKKEISFNYKKFFAGNVKELRDDVMNTDVTQPFIGLLQVETSDDGSKKYEKLFAKAFLPSDMYERLSTLNFSSNYQKRIWEKFKKEVEEPYGAHGYYAYKLAVPYNAEEDDVANGEGKVNSDVPVDASSSDY